LALPRRLRQDFFNIYAFCRHADDLADELASPQESLKQLNAFREDLRRTYQGNATHPIFIALQETISRYQIPIDPFLALIDAFEQDQRITRYQTYEAVLDYCQRSANPVGHLVLYLGGYHDRQRQELADFTCTALQLTNFWQDVANDLQRGRIYLPLDDMNRFGVTETDLIAPRATPAFIALIKFQVDRTEQLFDRGQALLPLVHGKLRTDIDLYSRGGRAILQAIRQIGYDVLATRPTLGKWAKLMLFAKAWAGV
jgi:squalene synthase HpnC